LQWFLKVNAILISVGIFSRYWTNVFPPVISQVTREHRVCVCGIIACSDVFLFLFVAFCGLSQFDRCWFCCSYQPDDAVERV